MKVSLIIPYYNGSKYIESALDSAYAQKIKFDEIIVVDDGSSDEESKYIFDLQDKYGFTILKKNNGGQGSARNLGVKEAKSEYICFLDQDDMLQPYHCEVLKREMKLLPEPKGWVYGDISICDSTGKIVRHGLIRETGFHPKKNLYHNISSNMMILPTAAIISKSVFIRVGGFDEQFTGYEDDDLFIRIFRDGFTNQFTDSLLFVHRQHDNQTSSSMKMIRSRLKFVIKWVSMELDNTYNKNRYYRTIYIRFIRNFFKDLYKAEAVEERNELRQMVLTFLRLFEHKLTGISGFLNRSIIVLFPFIVLFPIIPYCIVRIILKIRKFIGRKK